jgi:hypothetical protein
MNVSKIVNDIELLRNLGKTFENEYQTKAEADLHRAEGAVLSIKEIINEDERIYRDFADLPDLDLIKSYYNEKIENLIRENIDKGLLVDTTDLINEYVVKSIRKVVIEQLRKVISSADSKRTSADLRYLKAMGKVAGVKDCVDKIKSTLDERVERLENIEKAISKGTIVQEPDGELMNNGEGTDIPGIHPGLPLKAQRLAEEEKENAPVVS